MDTSVFRWHKALKDGREDVDNKQSAGRPSGFSNFSNVAKTKAPGTYNIDCAWTCSGSTPNALNLWQDGFNIFFKVT